MTQESKYIFKRLISNVDIDLNSIMAQLFEECMNVS